MAKTCASDSAKIAHKELVAVGLANERELDTTRNFERTCIPGLAQVDGDDAAKGDYAFYLTDHLGSTRGLYDSAKARAGGYQFSPYGHVYAATAFAASALYFAPYRYYSPTMARWLTRDPLGMVDGPNVYAYVMGNPVRSVDRYGFWTCSDTVRTFVQSQWRLEGVIQIYNEDLLTYNTVALYRRWERILTEVITRCRRWRWDHCDKRIYEEKSTREIIVRLGWRSTTDTMEMVNPYDLPTPGPGRLPQVPRPPWPRLV